MEANKYRVITFYKKYFENFFIQQKQKIKDKIIWTLRLIEELPQVPASYLKHLSGTDGLYEIRKTPVQEMARAIKIKKEYHEEKKQSKKP
jgi:hypothetical protein